MDFVCYFWILFYNWERKHHPIFNKENQIFFMLFSYISLDEFDVVYKFSLIASLEVSKSNDIPSWDNFTKEKCSTRSKIESIHQLGLDSKWFKATQWLSMCCNLFDFIKTFFDCDYFSTSLFIQAFLIISVLIFYMIILYVIVRL